MRVLLFVGSVLALILGAVVLASSRGALAEIEGFIIFLIAAVLFVGAAVVEQLQLLSKSLHRTGVQRGEPSPPTLR